MTPAPSRTPAASTAGGSDVRWLMASDVCKHCTHAACLDVCPTGALMRTEFGTVVVQADICNGCGYCVPACPYGVIDQREGDGRAWKCTLCYDRLGAGMEPACAKACPTESIQFGPLDELRERAAARVEQLHAAGEVSARLYGDDPGDGVGGDGAFFLLLDEPEVYGLPPDPVVTTRDLPSMWRHAGAAAATLATLAAVSFAAARLVRAARDERRRRAGSPDGLRGERPGRRRPQRRPRRRPALAAARPAGRAADGAAGGVHLLLRQAGAQRRRSGNRATSPGYFFLGGLAGGSSLLAAGADLTGRPALSRAAKAGAAARHHAVPGRAGARPRAPGPVPQHDAGVQGHLAHERRDLAAQRLRARGRGGRRQRAHRAAAAGRGGRHRRRGAGSRPPSPPTPPCCSATPPCPPGTRATASCRSCSPGRPRWQPAASACWPRRRPSRGRRRNLAIARADHRDGRLRADDPPASGWWPSPTTGAAAPSTSGSASSSAPPARPARPCLPRPWSRRPAAPDRRRHLRRRPDRPRRPPPGSASSTPGATRPAIPSYTVVPQRQRLAARGAGEAAAGRVPPERTQRQT